MPEIEKLAQIFSFFKLSNGEDVVVAGEAATFFVLVVNGRVDLIHPPATDGSERTVAMYKGDTLGDVSYFSGRYRTGTCRCRQNGTIIALLPFTKIMAHIESEPAVICKLVWMLAQAALSKLNDDMLRVARREAFSTVQCPSSAVSELMIRHCLGSECMRDVSEAEFAVLAEYFSVVRFEPSAKIFTARQTATCIFLHLEGIIEIVMDAAINSGKGNIRLHPEHLRCSWCGELAVLMNGVRHFDVIACSPVTMLMISLENLNTMRSHQPAIAVKLYENMVRASARHLLPVTSSAPHARHRKAKLSSVITQEQQEQLARLADAHHKPMAREHEVQIGLHGENDDNLDIEPLWRQLAASGPCERLLVQRAAARMRNVTSVDNALFDLVSGDRDSGMRLGNDNAAATNRVLIDQLKTRLIAERLARDHETKKLRQTIEEVGAFVAYDGSTARNAHRKHKSLQSELNSCQQTLRLEARLRAASDRNANHLKLQNCVLGQSLQEALACRTCIECKAKLSADVVSDTDDVARIDIEHWQALAVRYDLDACAAKARCEELSARVALLERRLLEAKRELENEVEAKLDAGTRAIDIEAELGRALVLCVLLIQPCLCLAHPGRRCHADGCDCRRLALS
jgi:CRP-like cAMP-binding protein